MPKYRKKPVQIEAVQFIGIDADYKPMFATSEPDWLKKALELPHNADGAAFVFTQQSRAPYLVVNTIEGAMSATHGCWIIRGVKGELYPCQPEIFAATYDLVEEDNVQYFPEHAVTIGYAGQDGHSYAPLGDSDGDDGA